MTWEPCCNNYPLRTGPCFLIETLSLLAASNQAAHSLAARRRRSLASERGAERGRCPPTAGAGSGLGGGVSAWWKTDWAKSLFCNTLRAEDWPPPVLSWWHASFLQKNSWQNRLRRRVRLADEPTQGCCRIQCMCMPCMCMPDSWPGCLGGPAPAHAEVTKTNCRQIWLLGSVWFHTSSLCKHRWRCTNFWVACKSPSSLPEFSQDMFSPFWLI